MCGHGDYMRRVSADCTRPRPTNVPPGGADGLVCGSHACPPPRSTIMDHGPQPPHRQASDIDLRKMAAYVIHQKSIAVRWIPGHRQLSDTRDAQQRVDILRNNEVDRLAKLATTLPLPLNAPTSPSSISLGGTKAPTLAKKWIAALRPYPTHPPGSPLGHLAPTTCATTPSVAAVAVGQHPLAGVPPPPPRRMPHARLIHCAAWRLVFLQEWVRPWADFAQQWLSSASPEDLVHISKLRVPKSSVDSAPPPPSQMGLTVPGGVVLISYDARHRSPPPVPPHASDGAGCTQNGRV